APAMAAAVAVVDVVAGSGVVEPVVPAVIGIGRIAVVSAARIADRDTAAAVSAVSRTGAERGGGREQQRGAGKAGDHGDSPGIFRHLSPEARRVQLNLG